jgi:uncharacterized protein YjeT (DUF2065 family)
MEPTLVVFLAIGLAAVAHGLLRYFSPKYRKWGLGHGMVPPWVYILLGLALMAVGIGLFP